MLVTEPVGQKARAQAQRKYAAEEQWDSLTQNLNIVSSATISETQTTEKENCALHHLFKGNKHIHNGYLVSVMVNYFPNDLQNVWVF